MVDQPSLPASVVSSAAAPLMHLSKQRSYVYHCTDEAGIRSIIRHISSDEREHVLTTLGPDYTSAFHTVGFCDKRPVQILSPFDIEPGPQRRAFLETLALHEDKNTTAEMPYLVYWFDKSLETGVPCVTLVPSSSIMSYEFGEKLNYDQVPKEISKKLLARTQELTRSEQILCDALVAMEAARESGALSWGFVPPDDVLYQIVRTDDKGASPRTPASQKQKMAPDALLQVLRPPETPSSENLSPERPHQQQPGMPQVGDRVKIWWESMDMFYYGYVDDIRGGDFYFIVYDDEETQWLPLADHKFEIVSEDEYTEETPPARELDPRFHCLSSSKPRTNNNNHNKSSPSARRRGAAEPSQSANRDEDSESEWKSSAEKQESPVAANKKVKSKSGKTSTSRCVFKDGLWITKNLPNKDANGLYSRPCGRSPKGFEWDGQNGWFAPISTKPVVVKKRKIAPKIESPKKKTKKASKKTKFMGRAELMQADDNDDDDDDFLFGKKPPADANEDDWWCEKEREEAVKDPTITIPRRDCRQSKPPEAGQASAEERSTLTSKQSPGAKDTALTYPTTADTCTLSKENFSTKNTTLDANHASHKMFAGKKPSKVSHTEAKRDVSKVIGRISQENGKANQKVDVERTAAKLAGYLPLPDDSTSRTIHQVHDILKILEKRDELSFSQGIRKTLRKPIKLLQECKHDDIRALAHSLSLKLKASYYVSFMLDLRQSVAEKDVDSVKRMVSYLYKKVTEGKKRLELDDAFIHKHGLLNLLVEISFLFHEHKVVMAELPKLENILNENMILEDNAEI